MSSEAAPFICRRLMFRRGAGVPGAVIIEPIPSVLATPLFPLTFSKWTESQVPHYPGAWRILRFNPAACSETSGLDKSKDDKLLTALSQVLYFAVWFHCRYLPVWGSSVESAAKHKEPAVAFWHDLRVNLCANDYRSWGKTLDAHSLSCHSAALSPSSPTISVLTCLSLADSRDIRQ